jgi:hypothetical protein
MQTYVLTNSTIVQKGVYAIWRGDVPYENNQTLDIDKFYKELMVLPQGQMMFYFRSDQVDES